MRYFVQKSLTAAIALALIAGACSSDSDPDGRFFGADEGASPGSGDSSVDIPGLGSDGVTIETDEGTVSLGGNQDLPDGLKLPVLNGGKTVSVFESEGEIAVVLSYPENAFDEVAAFYDDQMSGQGGFERTAFDIDSADGVQIRNVSWIHESGRQTVNITTCPDFTGTFERVTCVSLIDS